MQAQSYRSNGPMGTAANVWIHVWCLGLTSEIDVAPLVGAVLRLQLHKAERDVSVPRASATLFRMN